jgi:hypothetical protein
MAAPGVADAHKLDSPLETALWARPGPDSPDDQGGEAPHSAAATNTGITPEVSAAAAADATTAAAAAAEASDDVVPGKGSAADRRQPVRGPGASLATLRRLGDLWEFVQRDGDVAYVPRFVSHATLNLRGTINVAAEVCDAAEETGAIAEDLYGTGLLVDSAARRSAMAADYSSAPFRDEHIA